jgi:hypothetical protein
MADHKKQRCKKYSAEEQKLIEQKWAHLEAVLSKEVNAIKRSRFKIGHILYEMKLWLQKYGLNRGRRGRWQSVLRKNEIDRKTAENYIRLYQEEARIAPHKCVVAPAKKSQQNSKNNTVKPTALVGAAPVAEVPDQERSPLARVVAADEREADKSAEGRLPVGCIFVLTLGEKHKFMESVQQLGESRATQLMYSAVVTATRE